MKKETKEDIVGLGLGYIGAILLFILMLAGVLAYYPGTNHTFTNDMGIENLVYTIVGNSTPVYPEVIINSTNITIIFPQNMSPDSFDIVFLEEITREIVTVINSGGGSSGGSGGTSIRYKDRNVTVTEYITEEVPGETIYLDNETEVIKDKTDSPFWLTILIIAIALIVITLIIVYVRNQSYYEYEEDMINEEQ